jgi:ABC-2 type transport system ATP-binding protein
VDDQVKSACKKLMDLAKRYGVAKEDVNDTIHLRSEAEKLENERRRGTVNDENYKVESRKISDRVFALTSVVTQRARDQSRAPAELAESIQKSAAARITVETRVPFYEAMRRYAEARAADTVVFRCENLGKRFAKGDAFALEGVNLELRKGEVTGLLGVNGSGKSTLLRLIAGTLLASEGKREYPALKCRAEDWVVLRRKIAFVEQRPERWPDTVLENLIRQAASFGLTGKTGREEVDFILGRLGLEAYADKPWQKLSGGYRTRVELAKAMLSRPAMLVLDEPLAPLDIPAQLEFLDDLRGFARSPESPMPVLLSSQHVYEVEAVADQMLVLNDGKVVFAGRTQDIGQDRDRNWFEITCDQSADDLACALTSCQVMRIHLLGAKSYAILTHKDVTADFVLGELHTSRISVTYFRDASHSTRRFLDS